MAESSTASGPVAGAGEQDATSVSAGSPTGDAVLVAGSADVRRPMAESTGGNGAAAKPDGRHRKRRRNRPNGTTGEQPSREPGGGMEFGRPTGRANGFTARGNGAGAGQAARHMRAPAKPAPVASFDPSRVQGGSANWRRKRGGGKAGEARQGGAYAALDLGTNNCRLLVALPLAGGRFRVIDAFSRIVRLGEGMAASGRLSQAAMDRAVEALAICAAKMANHDLAGKRLIATEACRSAANGVEFLARVRRETGLELEIVNRETEARLAAEGCGSLMDRQADAAVLFDIGGGSSELVLVNKRRSASRRIADHIAAWTSMPIGVVTLSERHGGRHVSRESFEAMVADVLEHMTRFEGRGELADVWHPSRTHLLGTSGTVTTIAGVHLGLPRYDRRKVDGIWLSSGQVDAVIDDLLTMDYEARAENPCIGKERADLVMAGCAILEAIRATWPSPRLRVADRGLREGILSQLMHEAGEWRSPDRQQREDRRFSRGTRPDFTP